MEYNSYKSRVIWTKAFPILVLSVLSLIFIFRNSLGLKYSTLSDGVFALALPRTNYDLTSHQLPIFLLQSSTKNVYITNWGTVSSGWNRTAQYDDLIVMSQPNKTLPNIDTSKKRPVIIMHCAPKSGSTTLRNACKEELLSSCGLTSTKRKIFPYAYMDTEKFYPMVRFCNKTHHFCAKDITMPIDIPTFDDAFFIHMFPFRNYDEWAISALKQQYVRSGNEGCSKLERLFFDQNCTQSRMEMDFRQYGKTYLAKYKEYVVRRINEKNEGHSILLYHHHDLHDTLTFLSEFYNIPQLKGSNGHGKSSRPEGTCDNKLLKKFHECFSWKLTKLK
mmetsp:Transcript_3293/g.6651  ORF Transcript_3293/g.6651 Transcript_3293/m.6651 type:complete len:333 (-) Transcript_3293:204-1202(-)